MFSVPRALARQWHIPEKELFLTARQNTETFFPPALFEMGKFLSCYNNSDTCTGQKPEAENIIHETGPLPPALYILTNQIAVVILGKDFLWHRIGRDESLIRNLISIESSFRNSHVVPRIMPEPDGSESSEQLIRQLSGRAAAEKEIPLTGFDEQLKRRMEITELIERLDTEKKTIEQKLKLYMGDAEIAENDRYRITWKNSRTERLDTKALKQEQPEIYRKYAKTTESRRFLVKPVA